MTVSAVDLSEMQANSLSAGDYSEGIKQIYDSVIGELEDPTPDEEDDDDTMVEIMTYVVFFIVLA